MGSMRSTVPIKISCCREEKLSKIMPRSASRMPWIMTCFAVCAAIRPKPFVLNVDIDEVAQLDRRIDFPGSVQCDFGLRGDDVVDDFLLRIHMQGVLHPG